jgi:hypothetical protein
MTLYELQPLAGSSPTSTYMELGGSDETFGTATKSQYRVRRVVTTTGTLTDEEGDVHPDYADLWIVQIQSSDKYKGLEYHVIQYQGYQPWTPLA